MQLARRFVAVDFAAIRSIAPVASILSVFARCLDSVSLTKLRVMSWLKWKPTSPFELELAEQKLLSCKYT